MNQVAAAKRAQHAALCRMGRAQVLFIVRQSGHKEHVCLYSLQIQSVESVSRSHRSLARLFDLVSLRILESGVRLRSSRFRMGRGAQVEGWMGDRRGCWLCFSPAQYSRIGCAADEKAELEKMRRWWPRFASALWTLNWVRLVWRPLLCAKNWCSAGALARVLLSLAIPSAERSQPHRNFDSSSSNGAFPTFHVPSNGLSRSVTTKCAK